MQAVRRPGGGPSSRGERPISAAWGLREAEQPRVEPVIHDRGGALNVRGRTRAISKGLLQYFYLFFRPAAELRLDSSREGAVSRAHSSKSPTGQSKYWQSRAKSASSTRFACS